MAKSSTLLLSSAMVRSLLPKRARESHKGLNGHVLIFAGSRGMSGAAVLAARGALRVGAGLVTVAMVGSERSVVTHQLPEALTLALPETSEGAATDSAFAILQDYIQYREINAVAAGPGLSVAASVAQVIKSILKEWEQPLVLDADGLNNIREDDIGNYPSLVITPHPGELARLLHVENAEVNRQRTQVAEKIARDHALVCLLKGYHSVITDGRTTRLNPTGNPAMASGGMGDVLTGIIAGLLAQGLTTYAAACAGTFLHGLAADLARVSDRGLLASDVAETLPRALAKIGVH